jgi:hypothetical protein
MEILLSLALIAILERIGAIGDGFRILVGAQAFRCRCGDRHETRTV